MCRPEDFPPYDDAPPSDLSPAQLGRLGCAAAPSAMAGHLEAGCDSYARHLELCAAGVGFSSIPGPSEAEAYAGDRELVASEFHGRDPRAG